MHKASTSMETVMRSFIPAFEEAVLPHLDAAYNLARWLTRDEQDAEDVVQEAYLRAFKHYRTFKGGEARPWLLTIVRNTYYSWIKQNRLVNAEVAFDDKTHAPTSDADDPEMLLLRETEKEMLRRALRRLPTEFLEVIVLREFEELSYKQIAEVVQIPMGTVMSRLARARKRIEQIILNCRDKETASAVPVL